MHDLLPIVGVPATRPARWPSVVLGVCALAFAAIMAFGFQAGTSPQRGAIMEPVFATVAGVQCWFGLALFRSCIRRSYRGAIEILETGARLRFRTRGSSPASFALVVLFLSSFLWLPAAIVLVATLGEAGAVRATWCAPVILGAVALGAYWWRYRRVRARLCEYVIDRPAGLLRLPARRGPNNRRVAPEDLPLSSIEGLTLGPSSQRVGARLRGEEFVTWIWSEPGVGPENYEAAAWLAGELGVPLMSLRVVRVRPPLRLILGAAALLLYAISLAVSFVSMVAREDSTRAAPGSAITVREPKGGLTTLAWREWGAVSSDPPVILVHGSPGAAADFERLGPALARRVIAPDLPGFGESDPRPADMSALAHAREVLQLMDHLRVTRAHVVGWSLGGAVGLHMADIAPARVASLTLMASVSEQGAEGSGSYVYEHAKYAAGWAIATLVHYGIPHFGAIPDVFRPSMRNFWDTDMRPLRVIMERLATPTLIIHGDRDFLVPVRAAYRSHELIGPSSLVVLRASHFLPFLQVRETAEHLSLFIARHDAPGVPALRQEVILAPRPTAVLGRPAEWLDAAIVAAPWWVLLAVIALAVLWRDRLSASIAALLVSFMLLDFGLAMGGILLGLALRVLLAWVRGRRATDGRRVIGTGLDARTVAGWEFLLRRRALSLGFRSSLVPGEQPVVFEAAGRTRRVSLGLLLGSAVGWWVWCLAFVVPAIAVSVLLVHPLLRELGWAGLIVGLLAVVYLPRLVPLALTSTGRARLRIALSRAVRREYWSTLTQYLILSPVLLRLAVRHGLGTCSCCNPGIEGGGGMIGESKKSILDAFGNSAHVLPAALIEAGQEPAARARRALDLIAGRADLGGYPIILKPDAGQRGFALRLAHNPAAIEDYFRTVTSPVLLQRFHPGPCECGILWARTPGGSSGSIFSITRKEFPVLIGDGERTLERLILRHPRFHRQAAVFLERFAGERSRVPAEGERIRLAQAGNHCQGTLFRDGADLITPELSAAVERVVRAFASPLDMCRVDLRYESDEALKRGAGFAIVELNGTAGESTNIYDPEKSIVWAYGVLAAQWRLLYELGAERRREGVKPMTVRGIVREMRKHYRERTGSAVSD